MAKHITHVGPGTKAQLFKVIVKDGSVWTHHDNLTVDARDALIAEVSGVTPEPEYVHVETYTRRFTDGVEVKVAAHWRKV